MSSSFRSWVDIDCSALRHNASVIRKLAQGAGLIAVVKANAYGHGLAEVVTTLRDQVDFFAVASLEEALVLRSIEKKHSILLLSAALPCEYAQIAKEGFIPTISSFEEALAFSKKASPEAAIHFKVDTGMGRLGVWHEDAESILAKVSQLPLTIQSISTHLPAADSNQEYTQKQLELFDRLLPVLRRYASRAAVHVLNSAGLLRFPEYHYDFVRLGLALYGVAPIAEFQKLFFPALSWKTVVSLVRHIRIGRTISYGCDYRAPRDLKVGVLPVGYGDGYPRYLSDSGAMVLVNGCRCPILGRVTMDQVMVDLSHAGDVTVGSEVVLLGKQGYQEITATELANKAATIEWHLFTSITSRVHRCYSRLN